MPLINLDTHILVHALAGDLAESEHAVLSAHDWGVSAIVLWELAKMVQLGRLSLDLDDPETIDALETVHVWPLDLAVARTSTRLDFRGDPADELIAATSVVHRVPLVTRDRMIRRSKIVQPSRSRTPRNSSTRPVATLVSSKTTSPRARDRRRGTERLRSTGGDVWA